ncbi:MAG: hypothetical protein QGH44_09415, partial [Arenicellales bacterium]|nr:hypothetical protein [Arenicellales bacterium]
QLLVKEYFAFLQTQLSARGQKLIDLVPGNIIFSSDGNYQAIDQEWMTSHPGFGPEEALFRGLFYFLMQNAAAITIPGVVKLYGTTYRELIEGILVTTVDIDITGLEQRVDQFEKKFQNHVSAIVDGVDFQTLIHSRINDTEQLDLGICCDFPNDIESVEVHIPLAASAGRERTRFHLSFPVFGALPSTITI